MNENAMVTLFEEWNIIGNGTTGLTSWQGALFLTDWLLQNMSEKLVGKQVLELGCGPGFLGLHLLKNISLNSYTFTDGHPEVLKFAWFNFQLNCDDLQNQTDDYETYLYDGLSSVSVDFPKIGQCRKSGCTVAVEKVDWTDEHLKTYENIDLILAADTVYERTLIPPFVSVLKSLLKIDENRYALVSCTERSVTTLNTFESCLAKEELEFSVLVRGAFAPGESLLCSDVLHQMTRVYEIKNLLK